MCFWRLLNNITKKLSKSVEQLFMSFFYHITIRCFILSIVFRFRSLPNQPPSCWDWSVIFYWFRLCTATKKQRTDGQTNKHSIVKTKYTYNICSIEWTPLWCTQHGFTTPKLLAVLNASCSKMIKKPNWTSSASTYTYMLIGSILIISSIVSCKKQQLGWSKRKNLQTLEMIPLIL